MKAAELECYFLPPSRHLFLLLIYLCLRESADSMLSISKHDLSVF